MRRAGLTLVLAVVATVLGACGPMPDASAPPAAVEPTAAGASPSSPPAAAPSASSPAVAAPSASSPPAAPDPSRTFPAEGAEPAQLDIPSIGLTDDLLALGIQPDGTMQVPEDWQQTGWFSGGGRPGGRGPTVIAGHVDSPTGPAVFARLHELAPGDAVQVTDANGTVLEYVVTEVAEHAKAEFPTVDVFGVIPRDELRLITCGGIFDRGSGHYEDNLVVRAVRA